MTVKPLYLLKTQSFGDTGKLDPNDKAMTRQEIERACEAYEATLSEPEERPENMYTAEERKVQLAAMRAVSEQFYYAAASTGVHAFIEFNGLMAKFIDVCQKAHDAGLDYNICNTHTGQALPGVKAHDVYYMAEKLECIFGPTLNHPEMRLAFLQALFPDLDVRINSTSKRRKA